MRSNLQSSRDFANKDSESGADIKRDDVGQILLRVESRLACVESTLAEIKGAVQAPHDEKQWYTTAEAAEVLDRAFFTVREWCRHGRIHAEKRACGRGLAKEWCISSTELQRIRNEGLLPVAVAYPPS